MKKLNRMLFREIKKSSGQFIAIIIVAAMGVMMYTGINSTFMNLEKTRDEYYESYNFEHLEIIGYGIPMPMEEKIRAVPGVKMATGRIILNARLQVGTDNPELKVLPLLNREKDIVNNISITGGNPIKDGSLDECIVEKTFADGNGFKVGDVITPYINGKRVSLRITGICKSPEYVYILKEVQDLMPDSKKFGIIYISSLLSQNLYNTPGYLNDIAILLDSESSIARVKPEIENLFKQYDGIKLIERKDQLSNLMLKEEIDGLKSMGIEMPLVFFIVASVIIYIMMGRIIENKRVYIGILKSLGYKNRQILAHYMAYPIIIGASGSILGIILGYFLGMLLTNIENQYYGFSVLYYSFYLSFILPAVIFTFLFCILSAYTACKLVSKISPSESMKPPAPKKGKRVILEKMPFIWKSLKFSQKMKFRSISRNRKRNSLTAIGVVLSTAILVLGFSVGDSLDYTIKQIYEVEQNYDMKVSFKSPAGIDELKQIRAINNISYVEPVFEGGVELKNGEDKKDVLISALQDTSSLHRVLDENGQVQRLPSEGILMPERLVKALNAKVGDYIDFKPYFPGAKSTKIKISGISTQYLGLGVDMNINNLSSILENNQIYTGAVIRLSSSRVDDIQAIKNDLYNLPIVDSVEYRVDAKKNMEKSLKLFTLFSSFTIILAAIMSIAVIYNITVINIYEKKRELSSLKVMGFTKKEIRSYVYDENMAVGILSLIIGLPFGRLLAKLIVGYFYTTDAYAFPVATYTPSYAYAAVLIFLFILTAQVLLRRKIDRIDMVDVLKVRE
jgi:putative ABC transport system permease protein